MIHIHGYAQVDLEAVLVAIISFPFHIIAVLVNSDVHCHRKCSSHCLLGASTCLYVLAPACK